MEYSGDALRHDDHGGVVGLGLQRTAQGHVGLVVQRREAVVEQIDPGFLGNGAGNGKPLLLAAGNVGAALCDGALVALGLGLDELGGLCDGSCFLHSGVGDLLAAELQVAFDGAAEQHTLLGHITQQAVQGLLRHIPHIDAVHGDLAAGDIIEAGDQVQQTGLAAAGGADDGRGLAGPGREADMLQRVAVGPGEPEADVLELHHALPVLLFQCGLCGGFIRVMDGSFGAADFVDALGGHTGTGQHDGHHGQHQEGHDDLHGVGDEGNHLAHLHVAGIHGLAAEPDDQQAGAVHDEGHERHHGHHGPVGEQLGAHQFFAGLVEAFLFKGFAAEGTHRHDTGQDLAADEVQPVHQRLHDLEFGHGNVHQEDDQAEQERHVQHDDPCQARVALHHVHHAADTQNGRIGHHPQQDDADELHLLDVVGGAGDEGSGGEILDLRVGEMDNAGEGLLPQVPADGGRHPGGDEAHQNGDNDHQQGQAQHLAAHVEQIPHLHVVGHALGLIFQTDQQGSLAGHAGKGSLVHLRQSTGQLLLDHFPGKTGHLGHGRKLGADGVQILCRGGDGFGVRIGTFLRRGLRRSGGVLRQGCHGGRGLPGGGVGVLGRGHIQHDLRCGNGLLQSRALGIGQVTAELQNTIVLKIISVGILQCIRILFAHQKREGIQCALAHSLRQGAFNAALLDAGVHDLARVVRQGKVAIGLHEQQGDHDKAGSPVAGQLLENFTHFRFLPSFFVVAPHFRPPRPPEGHHAAQRTASAVPPGCVP